MVHSSDISSSISSLLIIATQLRTKGRRQLAVNTVDKRNHPVKKSFFFSHEPFVSYVKKYTDPELDLFPNRQ